MEELQAGMHVTPAVRLLRPIGQGGMGKVWVAEHTGLKAEVVVKLLSADLDDKEDAAARFSREASVAAAVKSPHVVQVFDYGITAETGQPYIVMELLEGRDLSDYLAKNGRMAPKDVAHLVMQIAKGLGKAHQVGVIHRDIKPENIFLCDGEGGEMFVKLLDFGIAKASMQITSSNTTTGQVVGTPYYMSPEQIVGEKDLDARTDIWSLGVVAFEALTGKRPFEGATVGAITLALHTAKPTMTAIVPDLPPALDAWFAKACARVPAERFATAREAALALAEAVGATAVGDPSGVLRAPMMSLENIDAFAQTTPGDLRSSERAVTSLSTSFAVPSARGKKPPLVIVGAAVAVILLLGGVAVFAMKKSDTPPANATTPPPPATSVAAAPNDVPPPDPAPSPDTTPTAPASVASPAVSVPAGTKGPSGGTTAKTRPSTTATARPKTTKKSSNDDDIK